MAFAVGALTRNRLAGPLIASAALITAVFVYYGAISFSGHRPGVDLEPATRAWVIVALLAGPIFGLAGALWRGGPHGLRPWAVALLSGAFIGEALFIVVRSRVLVDLQLQEPAALFALAELVVAAVLPFLLLRDAGQRGSALAMSLVAGIAGLAAIDLVVNLVEDAIRPF